LETVDPLDRLVYLSAYLTGALEEIELDREIDTRVRNKMDQNTREYQLREKIKAIHEELGSDELSELEVLKAKVADRGLPPTAQEKLTAVYEQRLKFFSDDIQARVRELVDGSGGIGAMQVAFWGIPDKRCRDGGRWDFKLGNANFLCDFENSRRHIHMSMKGKLAQKK